MGSATATAAGGAAGGGGWPRPLFSYQPHNAQGVREMCANCGKRPSTRKNGLCTRCHSRKHKKKRGNK